VEAIERPDAEIKSTTVHNKSEKRMPAQVPATRQCNVIVNMEVFGVMGILLAVR
jgi:hypothetical protein